MNKEFNKDLQFLSAKGFYKTGIELASRINQEIGNKAFEIAPIAAVNLSFSAELLLKLVYQLEEHKTVNKHELHLIYNLLPKNLKDEINTKYIENKSVEKDKLSIIKLSFNTEFDDPRNQEDKFGVNNLTIENLLKIHSEGFVKWRYAYEIENKYYYYDFNFELMRAFIKSLIFIIETKFP